MNTVYLARERHPARQIALKVLDPTLTDGLARDSFLREVGIASNLSHPHIAPIFGRTCALEAAWSGWLINRTFLCRRVLSTVSSGSRPN